MADIKINNISGSDLFNDAESFMVEVSDDEFIIGGLRAASGCGQCTNGVSIICTVTIVTN